MKLLDVFKGWWAAEDKKYMDERKPATDFPWGSKPCGCAWDRVCLEHEKEATDTFKEAHSDPFAFATLPVGNREWTITCTQEGQYLVYGTRLAPGDSVSVKELPLRFRPGIDCNRCGRHAANCQCANGPFL